MLRRFLAITAQVLVMGLTAACGSSPAAGSPPNPTLSASDAAEVAALEARPLHMPALMANGDCPPDSLDSNGEYGQDPVYVHGGPHTASTYGDYFDVSALTHEDMVGPVVIRGTDLKVANHPVVFVSRYVSPPLFVAGPQLGTDSKFGPQYTALVIDTAFKSRALSTLAGGTYDQWTWRQGIATGWSGCVGFQVDGPGFSFTINVNDPNKT